MLASEGARWAAVVAADLAEGELVEEELTLFVEGLHLGDLAAEVAKVGEPVAGIERKLSVDLLPEALGEGGGGSACGDGDLQVAAPDDGRKVKVAEGRIVDGVADDVLRDGFKVDGAVDGSDVGCRDHQEDSGGDVAGVELALVPSDLSGGGKILNVLAGLRGDNGDRCVGGAKALDF